jgi:hypothetical protein
MADNRKSIETQITQISELQSVSFSAGSLEYVFGMPDGPQQMR